ncbi:putative membrane protein YeiB [Alkalicoccobacillus murimartini]|uniref:Membrane protein YeiB n=1 Tax=Alkalicoccobacillus murimartini TaxID=171685 RepID=A0ABT9YDX6_9BACI|nr:putative membrane protein YeiB [Alkalicoccobacillus murimartini]
MNTKRFISLDLARGMMLLLVALAHASLYAGSTLLSRPESMHSMDTFLNYVSVFVVDNRARPMFAFLFGYGLTLIVASYLKRNRTTRDAKMSLYRRALYLLIFGFFLSVIVGGQDILAIYGAALLCITWLIFKSDKILIRAITIISALFVVILPVMWGSMAVMQQNENALQLTHTSYLENFSSQFIQFITGGPFLGNLALPIVVSILLGIWAGRKKLLNEQPDHKPFLKKVAIVGLTISVIGAIPQALYSNGIIELSPLLSGLIFSLHMITGIIGGVSYAAIFGLLGPKLVQKEVFVRPITALGKRSLTFFMLNEALLVVFLSTYTLNLGETFGLTVSWSVAFGIWLLALLIATILEKKQLNGPMDHLFRKLVHRKPREEKQGID